MNVKILNFCLFYLILQLCQFNVSLNALAGFSSPNISLSSVPGVTQLKTAIKGEKCYDELGCFKPFPQSSILVSIAQALTASSLYPATPESVDATFIMYTCSNPYRPFYLPWNATDKMIRESPFDPNVKTIFLIHGFTDKYDEMNWMGDLKDHILRLSTRVDLKDDHCDKNVIGVDWSKGAKTSFYAQAVANTQIVGAIVARFIKQLIQLNRNILTPDDFAVLGHSLGAQTAGFVGTHFKQEKIRTIIGLDPAGPAFSDIPETHRLDPSDAKLVVSVHTNGGEVLGDHFGIADPSGHYAFFPNGGDDQPGCEKTRAVTNVLLKGISTGISDTIVCSHRRAYRLVQVNETLLTTAHSIGYRCPSYEDFKQGKCGTCGDLDHDRNDECKPFGNWYTWWLEQLPSPNWTKPIKYFIDTTDEKPYTLFHHQIKVQTKRNIDSFKGYIKITFFGELRDSDQIKIEPGTIEGNSTYTYLLKTPKDLGRIPKALVRVGQPKLIKAAGAFGAANTDDETTNPLNVIDNIKVHFMSHEHVE